MVLPEWLSVRLFSTVSLAAKYNDSAAEPPNVRLLDEEPPKTPLEWVMPPLAMSVFEPMTNEPLVSASVFVTVVVPARFNVPPFNVSELNVAFPFIMTVPELIAKVLNVVVALPRFSAPVPAFVIPPEPLITLEIVNEVLIEKAVVAIRLSGQDIVEVPDIVVEPAVPIVNVPVPEIEVPLAIDFIVLQVPVAESTGLNATVPPKTGRITSELEVGTPTDQFPATFQLLDIPFQVLFCASAPATVAIKKIIKGTTDSFDLSKYKFLKNNFMLTD